MDTTVIMSKNIDASVSIFGPNHWKGEMSLWISTALCVFLVLAVFGASIPESLLDEQPKEANFTETEDHTLAGITLEEVRDDEVFNVSTPDSTTPEHRTTDISGTSTAITATPEIPQENTLSVRTPNATHSDSQKNITSTTLTAVLPIVEEIPSPGAPESPLAVNATEAQTTQSQEVATEIPTTTASTQPTTTEHPTTVIPPLAVNVPNLEKPIETETASATSTANSQADTEAITSSNTTTPEAPTTQTKSDTEAENEVDRKGDIEATTIPTTTTTIPTTTSTIPTTTSTIPTTTTPVPTTTTIAHIIETTQDFVTSKTDFPVPTITEVATESPTTSTTTTKGVPTTVAFTTETIRHLVPVTVWGVDEAILRTTVKPRLSRPWFGQTIPTTTEENVVIIHAVIPPEAITIAPTSPKPVRVEDLSPSQKAAVKKLLESKRIMSNTPLPGFTNPRPEPLPPFFIQSQLQTPPAQIQPQTHPLFPFTTIQTQRPLMTWQPIQTNFLPNGFNPQNTFLTHPGR